MSKSIATVLIPIYQREPTVLERISLDQTLRVLGKHPITFQAPIGLDVAWYENYCKGRAAVFFEHFKCESKDEFRRLMINPDFYKRFGNFEYLLICHLDAFVFRDQLLEFCQLGYDYIGAYIYNPMWQQAAGSRWRRLTGSAAPEYFGNGGFSLRRVEAFHRITRRFKPYIDLYLWTRKLRHARFLDDIFIALHLPRLSRKFSIAPASVAQKFGAAYEDWPEDQLPFTKLEPSTLPFGIHGWIKYKQEYWTSHFRELGYSTEPVASGPVLPYNFFYERHRQRAHS